MASSYKPRGLQPFDDKLATVRDLNQMEDRIMSAITDALNNLRAAVDGVTTRVNADRVSELERLIAAERAAEAAEDVEQEAALNEARAKTDEVLAEFNAAAGEIQSLSDHLNALGTTTAQEEPVVGDATPVDGAPTAGEETPEDATPVPAEGGTAPETDTADATETAEGTPEADSATDAPAEDAPAADEGTATA
jgi:hypothetical protein